MHSSQYQETHGCRSFIIIWFYQSIISVKPLIGGCTIYLYGSYGGKESDTFGYRRDVNTGGRSLEH